jgi:hypothetical protein
MTARANVMHPQQEFQTMLSQCDKTGQSFHCCD